MSRRFIFFSLRDFKTDAGETVRIYGLLNSLASLGKEVVFISNATRYEMFHPSIKQVFIGADFVDKRTLQGLLAALPWNVTYKVYKSLFLKIQRALKSANVANEPMFFFDYLDNSIGYILKKKGLIRKYVNDIHGIATLEFQSHVANSRSMGEQIIGKMKLALVSRLDRKVFEYADGFIFGSDNMRKFYESLYDLKHERSYVIPYVLSEDAIDRVIDNGLKRRLKKELCINKNDFIFLFVGGYKPTAGVDDLINAFDRLHSIYGNTKLILIGVGPARDKCIRLAETKSSTRKILFIEQIPYSQLPTYQSLAHVIVCPDKDNVFSQYVVHLKYLDALVSGALVINGAFESVKEINVNEAISLTFEPSNTDDLYEKMKLCIENYESLRHKYKDTKKYTANNLTYKPYIRKLVDHPIE